MQNIQPSEIMQAVSLEADLLDAQADENSFPLNNWPITMQSIIAEVAKTYCFHPDYLAASILSACSTAIGSSYKVKVKGDWHETALLFMVLVGIPGVNKSAPVTYAYKPLMNKDSQDYDTYKLSLVQYNNEQSRAGKFCKTPNSVDNAENVDNATPVKPKRKQRIMSDATIEAIGSVLSYNPRGVALNIDELAGLFKNFNRYNKGSDAEYFLQVWSNKPISINRKGNDDSLLINDPFVNIVGTTQPSVLRTEFNKDGRSDNGFMDRMLFVCPEIKDRPVFHFEEPTDNSMNEYHRIINRLLMLEPGESGPRLLCISDEAKEIFIAWSSSQADYLNGNMNDKLSGICAKIETYALRFALIFQLIYWACDESDNEQIEEKAMSAAIETAEYFKAMAIKFNQGTNSETFQMSEQKRAIYNLLPIEFTTQQGVSIAANVKLKSLRLSERRFKDWLNDETYFIKIKHGEYKKTASQII